MAAQSSDAERSTIEEITVIGRYPGPPLWKVASGENVLWIFGDLSPVPKGLDWDPRNAERVIDNAAVVIGAPRVSAPTFNPIRLFRLYRARAGSRATPKTRRWPTRCRATSTPATRRCALDICPTTKKTTSSGPRSLRCVSIAPRSTTSA